MNKETALEKVKKKLRQSLESVLSEAASAKLAATHEESKAENKYDTRGLEASYLAAAQSNRATEIKKDLYNLEKLQLPHQPSSVGVGCLVNVFYATKEQNAYFFILPVSGIKFMHKNKTVTTVSLESPLGKLLLGKKENDVVVFRNEELEVSQVT